MSRVCFKTNNNKDLSIPSQKVLVVKITTEIAPVAKGVLSKGGLTQATNAKSVHNVTIFMTLVKHSHRDNTAHERSKPVQSVKSTGIKQYSSSYSLTNWIVSDMLQIEAALSEEVGAVIMRPLESNSVVSFFVK